jgi:glutathione S-transferase
MTLELYHAPDARSFRCLWLLEELKLPYRLHTMAFPPRYTTPGYLNENPLGTIPLLVDGTSRLTESVAILQYLAMR